MLRRISLIVLGLVTVLAVGTFSVVAQDAKAPASLSLDQMPPVSQPLDMSIFQVPEKATAAELLKFVEELQPKLPKPKTQVEMMQLMQAMVKTFETVADRVLAMDNAKPEEKSRAIEMKVVALSAKSQMDPNASKELDTYLDNLVKNAKDTKSKIQAYQVKYGALRSQFQGQQGAPDEGMVAKANALADEIMKEKDEELQVLGLEIKAETNLSASEKNPQALADLESFVDKLINDNAKSMRLRNKASEIKLICLASVVMKDPSKEEALDKYFKSLDLSKMTEESRAGLYQVRLQTLLNPQNKDPKAGEKAMEVVALLQKEKSPELQNMAVAVKSTVLRKAAEADPAKVDALFKYADEILANNPTEEQKSQVLGMRIQAYMLKVKSDPKAKDDLIAFLDKSIADKPDAKVLTQLAQIKLQLLVSQAVEDASKIAQAEKAVEEFKDLDGVKEIRRSAKAVIALTKVENIAKSKGSVAEFKKVCQSIKNLIDEDPSMAAMIPQLQKSIKEIGAANNDPKLFKDTLTDFIAYCKKADKPEAKEVAAAMEAVLALDSLTGKKLAFEGIVAGKKDNEKFATSSLNGKVFLVDIWSTNNRGYFESIEELKELHSGYKNKGFEIVGVNLDDNTQMLSQVMSVFAFDWNVISHKLTMDAKMEFPASVGKPADGSRILVDKDGTVLLVSSDLNEIKAMLTKMLGAPEKKAAPAKAAETTQPKESK
ncbi:MAG: hypothetical protein PHQ75_03965 [Thermoguttaceae bacterium]|nr:hypothetical protein [Thermoguttaceae bacterium]